MSERLYRSERDRMIAGVCGGLAEHLDVDPTLVRIAFVALAFIHGVGIVVYLVMAFIVPKETSVHAAPREAVRANAREYGEQARRAVAEARDQWRGAETESGSGPGAAAPDAAGEEPFATTAPAAEPPPPPSSGAVPERAAHRGGVFGAVLIIVGLLLLVYNLGFFWWIAWGVWWPVVLVVIGVVLAARALRR